ncbi:MAG: RNA polymerase sigma factor [Bacteroidota bacterium]
MKITKDINIAVPIPIEGKQKSKQNAESTNTETEIIDGCKKKSVKHQELLYKKYYGYIMAVCLAYCKDKNVAQEVVNDVFIKVFDSIASYDIGLPFKGWLRRIAINCSIDELRKNKKFMNHLDIAQPTLELPSTDLVDSLTVQEIYHMLGKLPEILRIVFNLYEVEGYKHKEIADLLDIGESSSRTYLARAKTSLRSIASEHWK